MNVVEQNNARMEQNHLESMKDCVKAFTDSDKEMALKAVSDEMLMKELATRLTFANTKLKQIRDILKLDA